MTYGTRDPRTGVLKLKLPTTFKKVLGKEPFRDSLYREFQYT